MLIIDMPMPTRCFDCPMHDWTYGLHETRQKRQNVLVCNAHHELTPILRQTIRSGDERPDWCPIKGELPDEHGDLIDRQDAIKEFEPYAEYESNRRNADWVKRIKAVLNNMTAIIAAERKDDEQIH